MENALLVVFLFVLFCFCFVVVLDVVFICMLWFFVVVFCCCFVCLLLLFCFFGCCFFLTCDVTCHRTHATDVESFFLCGGSGCIWAKHMNYAPNERRKGKNSVPNPTLSTDPIKVFIQPPCVNARINIRTQVRNCKHWQGYHCYDTRKYCTHW